jgi:hypothetical protein
MDSSVGPPGNFCHLGRNRLFSVELSGGFSSEMRFTRWTGHRAIVKTIRRFLQPLQKIGDKRQTAWAARGAVPVLTNSCLDHRYDSSSVDCPVFCTRDEVSRVPGRCGPYVLVSSPCREEDATAVVVRLETSIDRDPCTATRKRSRRSPTCSSV